MSASDIDEITKTGFDRWLANEMARPNDSSARQFFEARNYDAIDSNQHWRQEQLLDHMIWSELLRGGSGVRKRMALALSEIFVVSINDLDLQWPAHAVGEYWDLLNRHAFGSFRSLIEAVTLNPVMGTFLDTRGNQKPNVATGRVPDENFAREVMQLFTIGLYELNLDGSLRTDGGRPIETYSNDDVIGLSHVFTGFDLDYSETEILANPTGVGRPVPTVDFVRKPMTATPRNWNPPAADSMHSFEEKRLLGLSIPPGTGPIESLKLALDHLCSHPNVAPFLSKQLIQKLVTSNPSPDYIRRVATVFENNGQGLRGDLGAVFKAVVTDTEATAEETLESLFFGKLREPMLRFAQWGQTFRAASASDAWTIRDVSSPQVLGQSPFRSPSVFNFFRPDFTPSRSQAAANNMLAPEFQIVDETTVAGYSEFMRRQIDGSGYWTDDVASSYDYEMSIAGDPAALLDHLDLILSAGQLRDDTRATIRAAIESIALSDPNDDQAKLQRVQAAVMLVMSSNDYLVQK